MSPSDLANELIKKMKEKFGFVFQSKAKRKILAKFLGESMPRLTELSKEAEGVLFLGYVFEELVRAEPRFYLSFEEAQVERFLLDCLQNKDGYGVLEAGLWHIPDGLKIDVRGNRVYIGVIYEIKTSPGALTSGQIFGHEEDLKILIDRLNEKVRKGENLPEFISGREFTFIKRLKRAIIFPAGIKVEENLKERLKSDGWSVEFSIFSVNEVVLISRTIFPEASAGLYYKNPDNLTVEKTAESGEETDVEIFIDHFATALSSLFENRYKKEDLREAAIIWLCSGFVLLEPLMAGEIIDMELFQEYIDVCSRRNNKELKVKDARFQLLEEKIAGFFNRTGRTPKVFVEALSLYYVAEIEKRIGGLYDSLLEEVSVYEFI